MGNFRGKITTDKLLWLFFYVTSFFPQAMTEKIEKLEVDMDTKEKVLFFSILGFVW